MYLDENLKKLTENYLFAETGKRIIAYEKATGNKVLRLGVGDVTLPLVPAVVEAMKSAVTEMGNAETFRGYPPNEGYPFLREAIARDYQGKGINVLSEEIVVSDGAKSDCSHLQDVFSPKASVLTVSPAYPVYVDVALSSGRKVITMSATKKNGFLPMPDEGVEKADIICLCSPNNPTGATYSKTQLTSWVQYAKKVDAVILFDGAYSCFCGKGEVQSIYEINGAKECAVEMRSFSKSAGFTGVRCGYAVIPNALNLRQAFLRRRSSRFNGVSYITQRGAEATFFADGARQTSAQVEYYKENARLLSETLKRKGVYHTGGENSPYIWAETGEKDGWAFFEKLLRGTQIAGTPGEGFGADGRGFFRFSCFCSRETVLTACERLDKFL